MKRVKQMLVNNGYSNRKIDQETNKFLSKIVHTDRSKSKINSTIDLFYENQMNENYYLDERVIKNIIKTNIKPIY